MTYSFNIASGALFGTRKVIVELQGIQNRIRHSGDIDASVPFVKFLICGGNQYFVYCGIFA